MTIRKRSLETACSNLTELFRMIERKADSDMYIAAMKQYIVNPLAYLQTEWMVKAEEAAKTSGNNERAVIAHKLLEDSLLRIIHDDPDIGDYSESCECVRCRIQRFLGEQQTPVS